MEGSARVVVDGDPSFETIVRGDLFLDTYPPTGARAMAAVRPLRGPATGPAHDRRAGTAAGLPLGAVCERLALRRRSRPRSASAVDERPRHRTRASGGWTPDRPALGHEVGGDRGDGPGDRRRRRVPDGLDGEVVDERDRPTVATALDADVLDVGAAVVRPDPAPADVGRREAVRRDRHPIERERLVPVEAEFEQDADPLVSSAG